jgi:flagellar biosynthetic protein FliR
MPWELLGQYLKLPVFGLVAARLGGLLMFQPLLGAMSVPVRLRVMLVLGLAAMITPLVGLPVTAPDTPLGVALAMGWEVLLGALIGLVSAVCFVGLQIGGLLVAQESGLAFGHIADPNFEEDETVLGVFYLQMAAVVYLAIGGHRALVSACLDTFGTIPLLASSSTALGGSQVLCEALSLSGQVAFRVAGPVLLALFLVNVAMGFVSRTMPQLNVLVIGFSLKALIAFLVMAVALPSAIDAFVSTLEHLYSWISELTGR